ncbi:9238_t:CDS:2, partial [Scutellospora calospora]
FASIGIVGYIIVLYSAEVNSLIVKYMATWIIDIGIAPCGVLCITWLSNNLAPPLKRNIGIAMMLSFGNAGGLIAAQIYRSVDYPNYVPGHIIASGFLLASICLCIIQYGALFRLNELKKKERIKIESTGDEKIDDEWKLGDRHYGFIYCL